MYMIPARGPQTKFFIRSFFLSIYLIYLSIYLSIYPSIYLSIYLSIRRGGGGGGGGLGPSQSRGVRQRRACRFGTGCAKGVWGIGVRLVCIIASFNYSAVSSSRFCPSSGAWGCGGRPRRSIRWLTPLGRRSVGLRGRPPLRIRWLTPLGRSVGG